MVFSNNRLEMLNDPHKFYSTEQTGLDLKKELVAEGKEYDTYNYDCLYSYKPCFEKYTGLYDKITGDRCDFTFYLSKVKDPPLSDNILVLIHGYRSKRKDIYTAIAKRFARQGISTFVYTLPFHFSRAPAGTAVKKILNMPKISFIMEIFRQSVIELRLIIGHLKKTQEKKTGLMGFSFGGYCTNLIGCLENSLSFIISMASVGGFSPLAKYIDRSSEKLEDVLIKDHLGIISPIEYMPLVDSERILFIQGFFDVRTPVREVLRFRKRWGNPRTIWYPCDHLTFIAFNRLTTFFVKRFIAGISCKNDV